MCRLRTKHVWFHIITSIIIITVFVIGIMYFYQDYMMKLQDQKRTHDLKQNVVILLTPTSTPIPSVTLSPTFTTTPEPTEAFDDYLLRRIDFDALHNINTDVSRWLFVPNTDLDAPVVDEPVVGEYFYDARSYDKTWKRGGSFLIPKAPTKEDGTIVDDGHLLILGHRMTRRYGEWQFSDLPFRWADASGMSSYEHLYMYYPDRAERWRVWLALDTLGSDVVYDIPLELGSDDYEMMLQHIQDIALYKNDMVEVDKLMRTMMWSTCNYLNGEDERKRFVLVSVPDAIYYYDTEIYIDAQDEHRYLKWQHELELKRQSLIQDLFAFQTVTTSDN